MGMRGDFRDLYGIIHSSVANEGVGKWKARKENERRRKDVE